MKKNSRFETTEFYNIVGEYINHPKVLEMKEYTHHGLRRYDHCFHVAYHTYKITKFLKLNYVSATKAAMLHDFYTNELDDEKNSLKRYCTHPKIALENARRFFGLTELEEDIIKRHMFPITLIPPKYIESWIVDIIDDIASIYERCYATAKDIKSYAKVFIVVILSIIR